MSLIPCLPPFHIHSISYRGWTSLLNFRFREWFEFAPWLSNSLHVEFSYILDMLVSECLSPARQSKNWYRQIYFSVMNYHPIQRVKAMTSRNSISTCFCFCSLTCNFGFSGVFRFHCSFAHLSTLGLFHLD